MKPRPIFAIGTGRCGTKTIAGIFDNMNKVIGFHEPEHTFELDEYKQYHKRFLGTEQYFNGRKQIIEHRYKRVKDTLDDGYCYFEASNWFSLFIDELHSVFPNAFFIHMVRDGRDTVRSGMTVNWYKPEAGAGLWKKKWWPTPEDCDNRFSKCCWKWSKVNEIIVNDLKNIPEKNKFTLHLEDMNMKTLSLLAQKIGLKNQEIRTFHLNSKRYFNIQHYTEWDNKMKKNSEKWMGKMQRYFNYE